MILNTIKRSNSLWLVFAAVLAFLALSVSLSGTVIETNCNDGCQEETGACCACICCPNILVMAQSDDYSISIEAEDCLWTFSLASHSVEQEWFTDIERPPENPV